MPRIVSVGKPEEVTSEVTDFGNVLGQLSRGVNHVQVLPGKKTLPGTAILELGSDREKAILGNASEPEKEVAGAAADRPIRWRRNLQASVNFGEGEERVSDRSRILRGNEK